MNSRTKSGTSGRIFGYRTSRNVKAPSEGATASTFIDDHKSKPHRHWEAPAGRLLQRRYYSLFHAEFAQLKVAIVSGPLDRDLSPLRHKWSKELSGFFDDEKSNDYAITLVQVSFPSPRSYRSSVTAANHRLSTVQSSSPSQPDLPRKISSLNSDMGAMELSRTGQQLNLVLHQLC
ncbi:hypothetical protein F5876DRAFT_71865 [Lentinula aff. lateritia]|uniref:Uncharacterized protein n=1 Tax=Lentinula aff. lateritia TaxID=2804960 RepID=A0ACC1UF71_9AGAR|nr:hypothetical protein F5876DRAFT_71865 [Lentinula aff. lateritia]